MKKIYAFDLDGTVTMVETLPILAAELGLSDEIKFLTELTLNGSIPFELSFQIRYRMLKQIPVERIQKIMSAVPSDEAIAAFIRSNKKDCALVTGNLDRWIEPISEKLGCAVFSSKVDSDGRLMILDKGKTIRRLKKIADRVIAIGESFNDVSMMCAADVSIAYAGVHRPVDAAISAADYVAFDGAALCRFLTVL